MKKLEKLEKEVVIKLKVLFENDKNGTISINVGLKNNETIDQIFVRCFKRRPHSDDIRSIQKRFVDDKIACKAFDNNDMIQVLEKETVRSILNKHLLCFLNDVVEAASTENSNYLEFAEISDYHSGEKEWINDLWENEISKKKRKVLLGKAQQLKDIIESFQIQVHNLAFKFLLYITSK